MYLYCTSVASWKYCMRKREKNKVDWRYPSFSRIRFYWEAFIERFFLSCFHFLSVCSSSMTATATRTATATGCPWIPGLLSKKGNSQRKKEKISFFPFFLSLLVTFVHSLSLRMDYVFTVWKCLSLLAVFAGPYGLCIWSWNIVKPATSPIRRSASLPRSPPWSIPQALVCRVVNTLFSFLGNLVPWGELVRSSDPFVRCDVCVYTKIPSHLYIKNSLWYYVGLGAELTVRPAFFSLCVYLITLCQQYTPSHCPLLAAKDKKNKFQLPFKRRYIPILFTTYSWALASSFKPSQKNLVFEEEKKYNKPTKSPYLLIHPFLSRLYPIYLLVFFLSSFLLFKCTSGTTSNQQKHTSHTPA